MHTLNKQQQQKTVVTLYERIIEVIAFHLHINEAAIIDENIQEVVIFMCIKEAVTFV